MKWTGKHDPQALADALRGALKGKRGITEKRMFGGVCFLLREHMLCGSAKEGYMFRVGRDAHAAAVKRQGARAMVHNGRRMEGFIWVDPEVTDLKPWIALADDYVSRLPPKRKKAAGSRR